MQSGFQPTEEPAAFRRLVKFQFRRRWYYYHLSLRTIAEKIVAAKRKYIDYPIVSQEDVELLVMQTLTEKFETPPEFLKLDTSLSKDLDFVH